MKNLEIINGDLNDYKLNEKGIIIPDSYTLVFKFYGEEIQAIFTVKSLSAFIDGEYLECDYAETTSDLLSSFEDKLEEKEVGKEICNYCRNLWKDFSSDSDIYDYLGGKIIEMVKREIIQ